MDLDSLRIDLKGLKTGHTKLEFNLDDSYFKFVEATQINGGKVYVSLDIEKTADNNFFLNFYETGTVNIPCDICLDPMEQIIDTKQSLEVRFGIENQENDTLVTIPENDGILDVTWFIYEFLTLVIPIRHVHKLGECNPAMIHTLEEYTANRYGEENEKEIDPRWAALSKLKE